MRWTSCNNRFLMKIRRRYHWKNKTRHISRYVKACSECQSAKSSVKTKESYRNAHTSKGIRYRYRPYNKSPPKSDSGNKYAVTIRCDLTKYLVTIKIKNKSVNEDAKAIFEGFVLIYGPMAKLLTDMGTEYMNKVLHELCALLKVEKLNSTPYHHETLGTVEGSLGTLSKYLRTYI